MYNLELQFYRELICTYKSMDSMSIQKHTPNFHLYCKH